MGIEFALMKGSKKSAPLAPLRIGRQAQEDDRPLVDRLLLRADRARRSTCDGCWKGARRRWQAHRTRGSTGLLSRCEERLQHLLPHVLRRLWEAHIYRIPTGNTTSQV